MTTGQTNLLKSWEEREEVLSGGGVVTSFTIGGDRHVMAMLTAVVDRYNEIVDRPKPTEDDLYDLIGQKVTIVMAGENALGGGILVAQEGKLFTNSGRYGILPKGSRRHGLRVKPENVLDVFPGYDAAGPTEMVRKARGHFPELKALTQERLRELPTNSETLSLCMFGSYQMPDSTQTDALYLASEYWPEDDILEGIVLLRPETGFSESGSAYGRQFVNGLFGEVIGFTPISMEEGFHLCNLDFEEAYEQVIGATKATA